MSFKHITCKLGTMRKPDEWILYPQNGDSLHMVMIQCDKRIARVDMNTGKAMVSDGKHGNSSVSLSPQLGAKVVDVPAEVLAELKRLTEKPQVGPVVILGGSNERTPAEMVCLT